ncbi:head-tail connector protein [Bacillus altitudinis]|uniref:head-tail connector protein n=1 Tax=Bacillus altitudinis TaxID=293387 RepID=UPI000705DB85|nr:head-tail connector protein [Bacillus altitudinis]ALM27841.1 DNA-packaging protein [Bacillus altitudinis]ALM44382.1 DNA-packaging protein [Bacillus altitudinis]ANY95857.1 DNA-packaging protein [Bacillus altitudinis]
MTEAEQKELEKAKKYLRIDGDAEDDLILHFIAAAKEYITNATGLKFPNNLAQAELAVMSFTTHWYENRQISGTTSNLDGVLTTMVNQLKYLVVDDEGEKDVE